MRSSRGSSPLPNESVEQDLDVDLVVGGVDARRVVDGVGVQPHAVTVRLDAPELGHAEVAALADDAARQVGSVDADAVVRLVADVGVGLRLRLDVRADAAVPEQVDGRLERGLDQLVRGQRRDVRSPMPRTSAICGLMSIDFRVRGKTPPPAEIRLGVVVRPRRPRQVEQPATLGEGRCRVGRRVDEHVTVVEGDHEPDVLAQQHAVAEHVAAHVADAGHGEVLRLRVDAEFAEVPLDRLPRAARRDAHRLVVVADRAARGEGVAEPEVVLGGDRVGEVGERRRALVGRDHQVRVVAVVPDDVRRRDDHAVDEIVGDVEHRHDELAVGGLALGEPRIAVHRRVGQLLGVEAALGADRHDDRVLDLLGLDQPEHLGAEVLLPVAPAQPAARDRAEPQVHALDARRVHPDLVLRPGQRQVGDAVRVELDGDRRAVDAVVVDLEEVGAQRRVDHGQEGAQDAVLVEAGDVVQRLLDLGDDGSAARAGRSAPTRRQPRLEQPDEQARDADVARARRPRGSAG